MSELGPQHPSPAHLPAILAATVARNPSQPLFGRRTGNTWSDVTAQEFQSEVNAVARGFIAAGIKPGDRVGLLSKTRYDWTLCDFALWAIAAVPVPIYETSSVAQIQWILADSEAVGCIVETPAHERSLAGIHEQLPSLKNIWQLDAGAIPELVAAGVDVHPEELVVRQAGLSPDSLATLIYTSGTTGQPKGCMLSHGNFIAECTSAVSTLAEMFDREDASTLLFLPLAHVFGRMIEVAVVVRGVKLSHSDPARLLKDLATTQPTFILSVPQVFEKIYETARRKAVENGKGSIFEKATQTAIAVSKARAKGRVGPLLGIKHKVFDKLVYGKLRAAFGGKIEVVISGGAPLGDRLGHFFTGIGITVVEGYGLTETTAAATANRVTKQVIGSVGQPLDGFEAKIVDGEIRLRGGHIFMGYYNNPEATAEVLDADGWFHTGDLGAIDDEGFLTITGRSKEIIVTAGGKNVAPAGLEATLRSHPLVDQAMVVGDQQVFVGALITLDPVAFELWQAENGFSDQALTDLCDSTKLRSALQPAIDQANSEVSAAEQIKKFVILAEQWTEANGYLTPTMKLKRTQVAQDFADQITALYHRKN